MLTMLVSYEIREEITCKVRKVKINFRKDLDYAQQK